MLLKLFLLFTVIPVAELYLLVKIGAEIGTLNTIFLVIATGIIGASFAKSQGSLLIGNIRNKLNAGEIPGDQMVEGVLILAGGILLVTPGIMTDIVGFSLIMPFTRGWYREQLIRFFKRKIQVNISPEEGGSGFYGFSEDSGDIVDVDGDVVDTESNRVIDVTPGSGPDDQN